MTQDLPIQIRKGHKITYQFLGPPSQDDSPANLLQECKDFKLPQRGEDVIYTTFRNHRGELDFQQEDLEKAVIANDQGKNDREIEHFYIDLSRLSLKMYTDVAVKIVKYYEVEEMPYAYYVGPSFTNLNGHILSIILREFNDSNEYYESEAVKLLIQHQYNKSDPIVTAILNTFTWGCLLPAIMQIVFERDVIQGNAPVELLMDIFIFTVGLLNFILELVRIRAVGLSHLSGLDVPQLLNFPLIFFHTILRASSTRINLEAQNNFLSLIMLTGFCKCANTMRFLESYGFIIFMIIETIKDMLAFLTIYAVVSVFLFIALVIQDAYVDMDDYPYFTAHEALLF